MSMSTTTIIIIIARIFGVCFLAMIPLVLLNKKSKGKADAFKIEALKTGAVVNFYGDHLLIDGAKPTKGQDYIIGGDLEKVIRLYPGNHKFSAKFQITDVRMTGNKSFVSEKLEFELPLEQGVEYVVGVYDDLGDENKTVFSLQLRTVELIGRIKYLVCERK